MPKIEVKLKRKIPTRSKTVPHEKSAQKPAKSPTPTKKSRSPTPVKSKVQVHTSAAKNSIDSRTFFTVGEDATILEYVAQHSKSESLRQMSENLVKKIKHSEESVRDRIRKILKKLRHVDHEIIFQEAKVPKVW